MACQNRAVKVGRTLRPRTSPTPRSSIAWHSSHFSAQARPAREGLKKKRIVHPARPDEGGRLIVGVSTCSSAQTGTPKALPCASLLHSPASGVQCRASPRLRHCGHRSILVTHRLQPTTQMVRWLRSGINAAAALSKDTTTGPLDSHAPPSFRRAGILPKAGSASAYQGHAVPAHPVGRWRSAKGGGLMRRLPAHLLVRSTSPPASRRALISSRAQLRPYELWPLLYRCGFVRLFSMHMFICSIFNRKRNG